jgi:protein-S-isoprenylcysteine O-methyltransferase Ste14
MLNFFDYFQIASVIVFLLILVGRASYLRLSRNINPIAIGGGKQGLVLAAELVSFGGLIVWIIEIFLYALHFEFRIFPTPVHMVLLDSNAAKLAGVALVILGLFVFVGAFISFGDSWRVGFDVKTPGKLVTTGLFAFTRNPIYVFIDLWFIGIFLINGTLIFLIFAALAFAAIHWQILKEEDFCAKLYGQAYREYCNKTRRYF